MGNSCALYPTVKVGNQEVESRLFKDLLSLTGNRDTAKYIWGLSQVPEFTSLLKNLEIDENGEPTVSSLSKALNLKTLLKGNLSLLVEKQDLGVLDNKGNTIVYNKSEDIINRIINYNSTNKDTIANINKIDKGYTISLEPKTVENTSIPEKVVFNSSLNNQLLGIVRRLGFDVSIDGSLLYDGIFDPTNSEYTADGLRIAIKVAKGKLGEDAFPEEVSHLLIAGLTKEPLVTRLLNSLNNIEVIKEILGDSFDSYNDKYSGNIELLKQEAAAKLLQQYLKSPKKQDSLISRIWNWIKRKLASLNESDIDEAITRAKAISLNLAEEILNESIVDSVDSFAIINSTPLYRLGNETNKLKQLAEDALEVSSKRMKILQSRSKKKKYNSEDLASIKSLQALIEKKKYAKSCLAFLNDSLAQINSMQKDLEKLKSRGSMTSSELSKIKRVAFVLRSIKEFKEGYYPIIKQMTTIKLMQESGEVNLTSEDALDISNKASEINNILNSIDITYEDLRFNLVYNFLKIYWGEDKVINVGKDKTETLTLEEILKMANKDINGIDRWIGTLSSASDPLLSLIDNVVKVSKAKRDSIIEEIAIELKTAHRKLTDAGYNTEFMYERDSNGKITGRIISNYDFEKFNKDREAYKESLIKQNLPYYTIKSKLESWERKHTQVVQLYPDVEKESLVPIYTKSIDVFENLSEEQKEYYNTMIKAKLSLESLLPDSYTNIFNAVQIRDDITMNIGKNITNPKTVTKTILNNIKDNFVRRSDDTEFGGEYKNMLLDFSGNPVNKLPIYYTTPLEDLDRLSLDFTGSMLAYTGMAVNYSEMNKIIDIMELTRDLVREREVQQYSGDSKLNETFKTVGKVFEKAYTKKGNSTNISERLDDYYDSAIYGKYKKDEGVIKGTNIDTAKAIDAVKSYSTVSGLGLNLLSALSNITMGNIQIFIESMGAEYFNLKNAAKAEMQYWSMLPEYLAEINSTKKTNKLALLVDKFDALEDFYESLRRQGKFQGPLSRILGSTSVLILNNLGEHYLHVKNMLAMLDAYKVKLDGKEISLFDAYTTEDILDDSGNVLGTRLVLKEGVTNLDGSTITDDNIIKYKLKIKRVNQSLNGAFNDDDKGAIHRRSYGRLIMLFRQWMPEHYNRRFASKYYDATLDQQREGFYVTFTKFHLNLMKDLIRMRFELATSWDSLSEMEKANVKRAYAEIGIYIALCIAIGLMDSDDKKEKKSWFSRISLYNLKRAQLEAGASIPFLLPEFLSNINTILQSPSAAIKPMNNLLDLIQINNIWNEIESGRYKGWSVYERDLMEAVPLYGKIRTVYDITDEDYMFAIFNR